MGYSPWGHKELDTTEWLHFLSLCFYFWKLFLIYLEVHWSYYEFLSIPSSEKAMAPHSSTLTWKIPWTGEPGGLPSMGSHRVRHDWVTSLSLFTSMHWRRKWQPTPVFFLENPRDRGAWWAAVYGVAQGQTRLKRLSSSILNQQSVSYSVVAMNLVCGVLNCIQFPPLSLANLHT